MTGAVARPILVTGAHRTATTWVGKMLSAAPRVGYISEPLNAAHRPGKLRHPVPHWYEYISAESDGQYLQEFRDLLGFRFHAGAALQAARSVRDLAVGMRDFSRALGGRYTASIPLVKDPFAVFSIPWFVSRFACRVVVTVRHPASFASSLRKLNWPFDFWNLLDQPALMQAHLEPFREAMSSITAGDILAQGALLWTMIYSTVRKFQEQDPRIIIVRHEDLSLDPESRFGELFGQLDLEYTPRALKFVVESSGESNPGELAAGHTHSVKLDSRSNVESWKKRLSSAEVQQIISASGRVASLYYPEQDWG